LPGFIFSGFPRTGSQFTQQCLQLHPEIDYLSKPRFFNDDESYAKGMSHYASLLSGCSEEKLIGEGDEHYLSWEPRFAEPMVIAERVHAVLPQAKILICIRNQVDFLLSGFRLWKRSGISAPFASYMKGWPEDGVAFARIADFYPFVSKYISLFGDENVKVLLYEDLATDEASFLQDIFSFLGVSTAFTNEILGQLTAYHHVNPAPSRKLSRVFDFTNSIRMKNPRAFRWIFPIRLYRWLASVDYKLFGSGADGFRATLSVEEIEEINQRYGPGNQKLSRLLDIDLEARGYPV
jgi:hypothetical protein